MAKTKTKKATSVLPPANGGATGEPLRLPVARSSASFTKVIMRPGERFVLKKGQKVPAVIDEDRLKRFVDNANEQLAAGHKIPAPFKHYKNGKIIGQPNDDGAALMNDFPADRFVWDSSLNGGFWKKMFFAEDASKINSQFQPGPAWLGEVEAPGDPNDPNTPAGKLGTTIQETSPLILPRYTDGNGREWEDFVGHVAIPVHAIEPGQDNFVLAMSDGEPADDAEIEVLSMSDMAVSDPKPRPDSSIQGAGSEQPDPNDSQFLELVGLLRRPPHNIDLPEETTRDTFVETLYIAVRQSVASAKQVESMTTPPPGATQRPSPIAMSEEMAENSLITALVNRTTRELKSQLTTRLQRLRGAGIIQKEENFNMLKADIDAIAFSAEDVNEEGNFPQPYVERQIALLESEGRPLTGNLLDGNALAFAAPDGADSLEPPTAGELPDLSAADVNEVLNRAIRPLAAAMA